MKRYKYPRTYHHPLSETVVGDDKYILKDDLEKCYGKPYVCTIKMDGECTTIYSDGYTHARSIDSKHHPSRNIVKLIAYETGYKMNPSHRICGENLFAVHSIHYANLPSSFMAFSIWDGETCLPWTDTFDILIRDYKLTPVYVVWNGILTEEIVKELWSEVNTEENEGLVFRPEDSFTMDDFSKKVFKLVRNNHVQSSSHWMHEEIKLNEFKS